MVNLSQYDETQVILMNEKCILVNEDDEVLGYESKKNCHLNEKINGGSVLHRAFSVFLFNTQGELLLQQRADEKITFPSYWTNTVCSHPLFFETQDGQPSDSQPELEQKDNLGVKRAAIRKLEHELGVPQSLLNESEVKFSTKILYKAASDDIWGEHEVDYILFIQKDLPLNPNPNEVKETKYVSKEGLLEFINKAEKENIPITPWFRLIYENFLLHWWDNFKELPEDNKVHKMY